MINIVINISLLLFVIGNKVFSTISKQNKLVSTITYKNLLFNKNHRKVNSVQNEYFMFGQEMFSSNKVWSNIISFVQAQNTYFQKH